MLLSIGAGIAIVIDQGSSLATTLHVPQIDPKQVRQSAINHLISLGVSPVQASLRIQKQYGQVRTATALRKQAPESVQSVWIDDNGTLTATVLDDDGAKAARDSGAEPIFVPVATTSLEETRDTLAEAVLAKPPPGFRGAAFEIDPADGKVVARYMFDANPVVPKEAALLDDVVTATAEIGSIGSKELVNIIGSSMGSEVGKNAGELCTAAWAVDIEDPNGGEPGNGVMTAGHCFNRGDPKGTTFDIDTTADGNTKATGEFFSFGAAGDYGYLRLEEDRGSTEFAHGSPFVIESIEEPVVGTTVCKDGATTSTTCGEVGRVGVTVIAQDEGANFLVKGQVRANFCSAQGDSGSPVYMESEKQTGSLGVAGLGILSSGRTVTGGACETYFTPLSGIDNQNKYHVRINGG